MSLCNSLILLGGELQGDIMEKELFNISGSRLNELKW